MHERPNQKEPSTGGAFKAFWRPWIGNRSRIKSIAGIGDLQNEIVAHSRELDCDWKIRIPPVSMPMGIGHRFFQGKANGKNQFWAEALNNIAPQNKITSGLDHFWQ